MLFSRLRLKKEGKSLLAVASKKVKGKSIVLRDGTFACGERISFELPVVSAAAD